MNIVIIGQGAIGLLLYCMLYRSQKNTPEVLPAQLSLKASNNQFIENEFVTFKDINQATQNYPLCHATDSHFAAADIVIICVKSYQVKRAIAENIVQCNSKASLILSHNGMGTIDELKANLEQNIAHLSLTHGAKKTAINSISHTGYGELAVGLIHGNMSTTQQIELTNRLSDALPPCHWHKSIVEKQWGKLAVNCVINPITALYNIDNGEVFSGKFQHEITEIIKEVILIAATKKITFEPKKLYFLIKDVASKTAKNSSSMRCDLLAKRQTEIDYINGYIVRLGLQHQLTTPMNHRMWQAVKNRS